MSSGETSQQHSQSSAAKLRRSGWIILIVGLAIAGMIYLFSPEPPSPEDDPLLSDYYKKQDQAMQQLWGNEGPLLLSLIESLKHARTYASIVAVGSILSSALCFYLSRDPHDTHSGNVKQN